MQNRTALITGASSGIGEATAHKLGGAGIRLILCGRRTDKLESLQQQLRLHTDVAILTFDVRKREEVEQAIGSLPPEWRDIDILINNAGNAHGLGPIQEGNVDDWDAMIDGNVQGLLYVSRAVMPGMIQRKSGHIINLSSVAGKQTYANGAVYCASKKAVEAISEGMRLDLTSYGIKVSNIAPGAAETEFSLVRFKGDSERAAKVYEGFEPLTAEDVADAIAYVVSAPRHVNIADMTICPAAQASSSVIFRKQG